jgi:hypothetical protein
MNKLLPLYMLITAMACQPKQKHNEVPDMATVTTFDSSKLNNLNPAYKDTIDNDDAYQTSTYDIATTQDLKEHRKTLKKLDSLNIFHTIHDALLPILPDKHLDYFKKTRHYELFFFANGDLFRNHEEDFVFIAYDRETVRISILTYNEHTNEYLELYRGIKVINGLADAGCNYGAYGTLDYQLADETLIYPQESLIKNPESYLENKACKIADIQKDDTFSLQDGCFAKRIDKTNSANSLCISTSSVYNNWECLQYDSSKKAFVVFFGQAFAD